MNIESSLDNEVAIIGLGYVGLTLGVALADVGIKVVGLEVRSDIVSLTNSGIPHFKEKGLSVALSRLVGTGLMCATEDTKDIANATAFFITVGTPLNGKGEIDLQSIKNASHQVASVMPENSIIIFRSTMKVGTARNIVKPIIESYRKKFQLAVCPERTLEGKALEELRYLPQIVGGFDKAATDRAGKIFGRITQKIVPVSSPETAEVVKLVDNTYRDIQFAFGNEVAGLCNVLDGVHAGEVIRLGKMDYARTNVAMPGLVGGPCLSKDPHILNQSAEATGTTMSVTLASRAINEAMPSVAADFIVNRLKSEEGIVVTIAGFAFKGKPETDDLRGSMSIDFMNAFQAAAPNAVINIFDPIVKIKDLQEFSENCFDNFKESIADSTVLVICNNHEFFSSIDLQSILIKHTKIKMIYDFWNHFDYLDASQKKALRYVTYGNHWLFSEQTT